jgi:hypothetical protein
MYQSEGALSLDKPRLISITNEEVIKPIKREKTTRGWGTLHNEA